MSLIVLLVGLFIVRFSGKSSRLPTYFAITYFVLSAISDTFCSLDCKFTLF